MAKYNLRVVNIVASGSIHREVDLDEILKIFPTSELVKYKVKKVVIRDVELRKYRLGATVSVFRTGKFIVSGASSFKTTTYNVIKFAKTLKEHGLLTDKPIELNYVNAVVLANMNFRVNLDVVALALPNCEYEPEQFPGLIYKLKKGSILLFTQGKVIVSGILDLDEVVKILDQFKLDLAEWGVIGTEEL